MVRAALPILFIAATGCSAVVGSGSETDAQSASVTGVIVVDRTVGADGTRGEASARFVRFRGELDDGTLRLVGAGLDLPPVGECAVLQDQSAARAVELLDVGNVSIESLGNGQHVALSPRQVPDVVDLVSGTMYSARIDEGTVPSDSDVAVLVGGSTDVPAFSVRAKTPDAPSAVILSSLDGPAADLSWASTGDAIYVDVGSSRCSFADDGHASLPTSIFGDEGTLTVHRVRREKLSIPGLDGGELRFDFARTIAYRR
ncbi:MAG TPA: hypothetical protein VGH28_03850 [Polyangiaceae bacterium]